VIATGCRDKIINVLRLNVHMDQGYMHGRTPLSLLGADDQRKITDLHKANVRKRLVSDGTLLNS
jgi:hypothetical protein